MFGLGEQHPKRSRKKKSAPRPALTYDQLLSAPRANIFEVRVRQAEVLKEAANMLYKQGDVGRALPLYRRALHHADFEQSQFSFGVTGEQRWAVQRVCDTLHLNAARCLLRQGQHRAAVKEVQYLLTTCNIGSADLEGSGAGAGAGSEAAAGSGEEADETPAPATPAALQQLVSHSTRCLLTARMLMARAYLSLDELDACEEQLKAVLQGQAKEAVLAAAGEKEAEGGGGEVEVSALPRVEEADEEQEEQGEEQEQGKGEGEGEGEGEEPASAPPSAPAPVTLPSGAEADLQARRRVMQEAQGLLRQVHARRQRSRSSEAAAWKGKLGGAAPAPVAVQGGAGAGRAMGSKWGQVWLLLAALCVALAVAAHVWRQRAA